MGFLEKVDIVHFVPAALLGNLMFAYFVNKDATSPAWSVFLISHLNNKHNTRSAISLVKRGSSKRKSLFKQVLGKRLFLVGKSEPGCFCFMKPIYLQSLSLGLVCLQRQITIVYYSGI